jgi:hypothetical protein
MPTFHFYKGGAMVHMIRGADAQGLQVAIEQFKGEGSVRDAISN